MGARIRRFNVAKGGAPNAFHETLTRAWLAVIRRFVRAHAAMPAAERLALATRVLDKDYLLRFYTPACLYSETARFTWVEPDAAPFGIDVELSDLP
jgi:hypothetical protein